MATSFQAYVDRENMTNPSLKNSISKATPGQRGLSAKPFHETKNPQPTPRKALGDLGNIRQGTGKKFETPKAKPSRMRIFEDTPKTNQRKSSKAKGTFSVFNGDKTDSKTRKKIDCEDSYPEIEKMTPFTEPEYDLPTPQYITRLLQHSRIINPSSLITPRKFVIDDASKTLPSGYEYDTIRKPCFDDMMADIIGCPGVLEFCEIDTDLPSLDDIPLEMPLL